MPLALAQEFLAFHLADPASFFAGLAGRTFTTPLAQLIVIAVGNFSKVSGSHSNFFAVLAVGFFLDLLMKVAIGFSAQRLRYTSDVWMGILVSFVTSYGCCCGLIWATPAPRVNSGP